MALTPQQKDAIGARLDVLMKLYVALSREESLDGKVLLPGPVAAANEDRVRKAFLDEEVAFDPDVMEIYTRLSGLNWPMFDAPLFAHPGVEYVDHTSEHAVQFDFESAMDVAHLWPLDEAEEEIFPYLMIGNGPSMCLSVDHRGLWSTAVFDGEWGVVGTPADFTRTFFDAFQIFSASVIDEMLREAQAGEEEDPEDLPPQDLLEIMEGRVPARWNETLAKIEAEIDLDAVPRLNADWHPLVAKEETAAPGGPAVSFLGSDPLARLDEGLSIVGLSFGEYPKVRDLVKTGDRLRLMRAFDNEFDPHAVEVWWSPETGDPVRLGFVPRTVNQALWARIEAGEVSSSVHVMEKEDGFVLMGFEKTE